MKASCPLKTEELIVDGLILNSAKPFTFNAPIPRNDSWKSTASTNIGAGESNEELEIKAKIEQINRALFASEGHNYQEIY